MRLASTLTIACLAALVCGGCAHYQFGARSLYASNVQTIYVPMIESDSLRRGLGERLTEAVVKEIELKTPYKVVGDPNADSILTGRIVSDKKRVLVETANDDPRALELDLVLEATWINRRGDVLGDPRSIAMPAGFIEIGQTETLIPEAGQSIATAQQQAIVHLAEQIVATMETPW